MSKTVLYIAMTLDGFIAGPNDEIDWLDRFADIDYGYDEFISGIGAVVVGRRTYDIGVEKGWGWPYAVPAFVLTRRPPAAPHYPDADIAFTSADIASILADARNKAGEKGVWIVGGGDVVHQCLEGGLLDEITVGLAPMLLGSGVRLFGGPSHRVDLELIRDERYAKDLVMLTYRVRHA